jgi:Xaa-Pro aminopeptidase
LDPLGRSLRAPFASVCYYTPVELSNEWKAELAQRRSAIASELEGGALVLFGADVRRRNSDVEYDFRQESNFWYLTGFNEPGSALVIRGEAPHFVLFVPPKDREREIWDGRRAGVEGALVSYGADVAYSVTELAEKLPDLLENLPSVWTPFGSPELVDPRLTQAIFAVRARRRKRVDSPSLVRDAGPLLGSHRLRKSAFEIGQMRRAAGATAQGHRAAMAHARPGMNEFELQRVLEDGFRRGGCRHVAYSSIVGGGANATILHYRENDAPLPQKGLVLIDAGAEFEGYASDVTRTFPVTGRFSKAERDLYEIVLDAERLGIEMAVIGQTIDRVHEVAITRIEAGLLELGILKATHDDAGKRLVEHYFMHRTSHYLGLDVHDVGAYYRGGSPIELEPGVVITVEPGVYISENDESVSEEYRGIGIRIEDDVLITPNGPDVLTVETPKTVSEVEAACALGR